MNKHILRILTLYLASFLSYAAKIVLSTDPSNELLRWIGGAMVVLGLLYFFFEIRSNAPYFYGSSQSAGSNATAAIVAGIGVGIVSFNLIEVVLFGTCSAVLYIVILSFFLINWERKSG